MNIIDREEWNAAPPRGYLTPIAWPAGVTLWVHHSEGPASTKLPATLQTVRGIQAFHQGPSRGWSDIGYAFLVDSIGNVIEGRGRFVGAHSPGKNHEPSVCMLGDYDHARVHEKMRAAVEGLADYLRAGDLAGHRENTATTCPGRYGMSDVVERYNEADDLTLAERLKVAGWGAKSIPVTIERLRRKQFGTIPNPTDSLTFRRLRAAGFGAQSARLIIATNRKG